MRTWRVFAEPVTFISFIACTYSVVIQVEFSTPTFMGTEMSRSVPVSLAITNGSIARSFSVSVQPLQLMPPSATSTY